MPRFSAACGDRDRTINLFGDDVDARVGESVSRFGLLLRFPPSAVPDHGRRRLRIDGLRAERKGVDRPHQLRDLEAALKAQLAGLADMRGGNACEIHAAVAVGPIGADILRCLEAACMQDGHVGMFLAHLDGVVEIAIAGRKDDLVAAGDQSLHHPFDLGGFRNELKGRRGHAGHVLLDIFAPVVHRGVVAGVRGRPDIDEADLVLGGAGVASAAAPNKASAAKRIEKSICHLLLNARCCA